MSGKLNESNHIFDHSVARVVFVLLYCVMTLEICLATVSGLLSRSLFILGVFFDVANSLCSFIYLFPFKHLICTFVSTWSRSWTWFRCAWHSLAWLLLFIITHLLYRWVVQFESNVIFVRIDVHGPSLQVRVPYALSSDSVEHIPLWEPNTPSDTREIFCPNWTENVVTIFARVRHWYLSWATNAVHSPRLFSVWTISVLFFHLGSGFPSYLFPSSFSNR